MDLVEYVTEFFSDLLPYTLAIKHEIQQSRQILGLHPTNAFPDDPVAELHQNKRLATRYPGKRISREIRALSRTNSLQYYKLRGARREMQDLSRLRETLTGTHCPPGQQPHISPAVAQLISEEQALLSQEFGADHTSEVQYRAFEVRRYGASLSESEEDEESDESEESDFMIDDDFDPYESSWDAYNNESPPPNARENHENHKSRQADQQPVLQHQVLTQELIAARWKRLAQDLAQELEETEATLRSASQEADTKASLGSTSQEVDTKTSLRSKSPVPDTKAKVRSKSPDGDTTATSPLRVMLVSSLNAVTGGTAGSNGAKRPREEEIDAKGRTAQRARIV